jgi:uncharacterized GH25 family protein
MLASALFLASATAAEAHDFWLEPEQYAVAPGEPVSIAFTIGHAGAHEPWALRREKIAELKSCAGGRCVAEPDIVADTPAQRGRAHVALKTEGTAIIAFESTASFSELGAAKFDDYARQEGLTAIIADRAAAKTGKAPGRELYSRRAKALIRVGDGEPGDVSAPVGHTLEIVPLKNPYALKPGEALPLRVLYNGEPLEGATIDLDDLGDDRDPLKTAVTDAAGAASFTIDRPGDWKLMTVWGAPREDRRRADYDTIFASLTFGF